MRAEYWSYLQVKNGSISPGMLENCSTLWKRRDDCDIIIGEEVWSPKISQVGIHAGPLKLAVCFLVLALCLPHAPLLHLRNIVFGGDVHMCYVR